MTGPGAVVVTCEHARNRVPPRYAALFRGAAAALAGHRGFDPGALAVARALARRLGAPLIATEVSRLLVEANRSLDHPALFSEFSRGLPAAERRALLERWYLPHRAAVAAAIEGAGRRGRAVLHVAAHSFTPRLAGRVRRYDVGLLFDPARRREAALCAAWRAALRRLRPDLRVRFNLPYRGWTDGLTTALRRRFPPSRYLGVELELNQALAAGWPDRARAARRALAESLDQALHGGGQA